MGSVKYNQGIGLKHFAVLSTVQAEVSGEKIEIPKSLEKNLKRLKKLSRKHSKKQKGSNNRRKSAIKLAKLHRRIRNQRKDFLHKLSTRLAKTKSVIVSLLRSDRRSIGKKHDKKPPLIPSLRKQRCHSRCKLGRIQANVGIQNKVVWIKTSCSIEVLPLQQDVQRMWLYSVGYETVNRILGLSRM